MQQGFPLLPIFIAWSQPNSITSWRSNLIFQTLSCRNFSTFFSNNPLHSTLFSAPHALNPPFILCTNPFHICHLAPQVLKQSTTSYGSPFSLTCIRLTFTYLNNLLTLLLPTLTRYFLLWHSLPNLLTRLTQCHRYLWGSLEYTSAVSSANNSWFISNLPHLASNSSSPFSNTLLFTSRATPATI